MALLSFPSFHLSNRRLLLNVGQGSFLCTGNSVTLPCWEHLHCSCRWTCLDVTLALQFNFLDCVTFLEDLQPMKVLKECFSIDSMQAKWVRWYFMYKLEAYVYKKNPRGWRCVKSFLIDLLYLLVQQILILELSVLF